MSHPDAERLADLALEGSADQHTSDHVAGCAACAEEVQALRRIRSLVRAGAESVDWQEPPAELWSTIEAAIDVVADPSSGSGPASSAAPESVAPVSKPMTRPSGDEMDVAPISLEQARRRRRPLRTATWLIGVAAAGAAVGLLSGRALWAGPTTQVVQPTAVAATGLETLDTSQLIGEATVLREQGHLDLSLALNTASLPRRDSGFLEVWLINKDGRRMVSIGVLDAMPGQASTSPTVFPISQSLIDAGYVVVDVSREAFDDNPLHSGDSLARGTLA